MKEERLILYIAVLCAVLLIPAYALWESYQDETRQKQNEDKAVAHFHRVQAVHAQLSGERKARLDAEAPQPDEVRTKLAGWVTEIKILMRRESEDARRIRAAELAVQVSALRESCRDLRARTALREVSSYLRQSAEFSGLEGLRQATDAAEAHLLALR